MVILRYVLFLKADRFSILIQDWGRRTALLAYFTVYVLHMVDNFYSYSYLLASDFFLYFFLTHHLATVISILPQHFRYIFIHFYSNMLIFQSFVYKLAIYHRSLTATKHTQLMGNFPNPHVCEYKNGANPYIKSIDIYNYLRSDFLYRNQHNFIELDCFVHIISNTPGHIWSNV